MVFLVTIYEKRLDKTICRYLGCHDALALLYEVTLGAVAVSVLAAPLVALQPGDDAVVPAARTLGPPHPVPRLAQRRLHSLRSQISDEICLIFRLVSRQLMTAVVTTRGQGMLVTVGRVSASHGRGGSRASHWRSGGGGRRWYDRYSSWVNTHTGSAATVTSPHNPQQITHN